MPPPLAKALHPQTFPAAQAHSSWAKIQGSLVVVAVVRVEVTVPCRNLLGAWEFATPKSHGRSHPWRIIGHHRPSPHAAHACRRGPQEEALHLSLNTNVATTEIFRPFHIVI